MFADKTTINMRHFIFILLTGIIFGFGANAQEVKRTEPDISDYIPLLNAAGYEVFTFDISSLSDETYNIELIVREYVDGALVEDPAQSDGPRFICRNRRMLSDFPEESWNEIIEQGPVYDLEKGILTLSKKISVGFSPSADSLKMASILVENIGALGKLLPLKAQKVPSGLSAQTAFGLGSKYMYDYRPFKVGAIQLGEFTPLVLLGSYWYDDEAGFFRFCGEDELEPDLSSKMITSIPHFYVLGIIVTKR